MWSMRDHLSMDQLIVVVTLGEYRLLKQSKYNVL